MTFARSEKKRVRDEMTRRLESIDADWRAEASAAICAGALGLLAVKRAKSVSTFVGQGVEVDTTLLLTKLIEDKGFAFVPCSLTGRRTLAMRKVDAYPAGFVTGPFGIQEPDPKVYPVVAEIARIDVIFLPGVAFDRSGGRLGRGAGYYDRTLASAAGIRKIGLGFGFQLVKQTPQEPHDIRLDAIVTEEGVIEFAVDEGGR